MSLLIKDEAANDTSNANGGTELMRRWLEAEVDGELLSQVNIIPSRVRDNIDPILPNILWLHDTWDDPENEHLKDPKSVQRFAAFVFVSNYQMGQYQVAFNLPPSKCIVLRNAIYPIESHTKNTEGTINLIYHTTPHRGLELLEPAVEYITSNFDFDIHLDVYSSFKAYGWEQRDQPYQKLFDRIDNHPNMTYHGFQRNDVIRKALQSAHIFAYPCIWPETSCIAMIEAMSAGCLTICPEFGALPETTGSTGVTYPYTDDPHTHVNIFSSNLINVLNNYENFPSVGAIKNYADSIYGWERRKIEWEQFLTLLIEREQTHD